MGRSWVRSRRCWGCDLVSAGVRRDRCDLGLGAVVRSGVGCGGAIWGWLRWCDLGLDAVVQYGVVVHAGVGCGGAIWGCGVHDLASSTLSYCSWFSPFFFLLEMV